MNIFRRRSSVQPDASNSNKTAGDRSSTNNNHNSNSSTTTNSNNDVARSSEPATVATIANRTTDSSTAPLITTPSGDPTTPFTSPIQKRRRSSLAFFRKSSLVDPESGEVKVKEKKKLLSDSGPYIFAFDPVSGKEVLQKNPHWPYEDSWKREGVRDRGETDNTVAPGGLGFGVNNW